MGETVKLYSIKNDRYFTRLATVTMDHSRTVGEWFRYSGSAVEGESGGALLDSNGLLVGILTAADAVSSVATDAGLLYRVATKNVPKLVCVGTVTAVQPIEPIPDLITPTPENAKLDQILVQLNKLTTVISNANIKVDANSKAIAKGSKVVSSLEKRLSSLEKRLSRLENEVTTVRIYTTDGELVDSKKYKKGVPIDLYLVPRKTIVR